VTVAQAEAPALGGAPAGGGLLGAARRLKLERPKTFSFFGVGGASWVLQEAEFGPGLVGGKSANLAALRGRLPPG
jgi:alpha-glucan,water dikinase